MSLEDEPIDISMAGIELRLSRERRGARRLLDVEGNTWATIAYEPPAAKATSFSFSGEVEWTATQTGGFGRFVIDSGNDPMGIVRYRRARSLLRGRISWEVTGPSGEPVTTLLGDVSGTLSEIARTMRRRPVFSYAGEVGGEAEVRVTARFRRDPHIVAPETIPDRSVLLVTAAVIAILCHPSD